MENTEATNFFPSFTSNTFDESGNLLLLPEDDIIDAVCCIRPSLKQMTPRVDTIISGDKTIFNNYGHSGLGWSLYWGTVLDSFAQFENTFANLSLDTPIAILGSGIVGCATFLKLHESGFTNLKVYSKDWNNSASWGAGAILSLTPRDLPYSQEEQDKVNNYFLETFIYAKKIIEGKTVFENKSKGVQWIKGYFGTDSDVTYDTYEGLDILISKDLLQKPVIQDVNFGDVTRKMKVTDVIWYNPYSVMNEFHELVKKYAKCVETEVTDVNDIEENIVFNCMGLGGSVATNDGLAKPTCGHILKLKDCLFDGILMVEMNLESERRLFYYFPKTDGKTFKGIIGGTFCEGYDGSEEERNKKEFIGMYEAAKLFFGLRKLKMD